MSNVLKYKIADETKFSLLTLLIYIETKRDLEKTVKEFIL